VFRIARDLGTGIRMGMPVPFLAGCGKPLFHTLTQSLHLARRLQRPSLHAAVAPADIR
jgi:hypothetical protein